jgi:Uma2 family endonuclease
MVLSESMGDVGRPGESKETMALIQVLPKRRLTSPDCMTSHPRQPDIILVIFVKTSYLTRRKKIM